jgi:hypothetical protein
MFASVYGSTTNDRGTGSNTAAANNVTNNNQLDVGPHTSRSFGAKGQTAYPGVMNDFRMDVILTIFVVNPVVFITIILALFLPTNGDMQEEVRGVKQIPTISLAGSIRPGDIFLNIGLHLEAACFVLLLNALYHIYTVRCQAEEQYATDHVGVYFNNMKNQNNGCLRLMNYMLFSSNIQTVKWWITASYWIGNISALCMFMCASVSLKYYANVHRGFAYPAFILAALFMLVFHFKVCRPFIVARAPSQIWLVSFQYAALFILIFFSAAMLILQAIVSSSGCDDRSCRQFSTNATTILEYSTVLSLLFFLESFRSDMEQTYSSTVYTEVPSTVDIERRPTTAHPTADP